MKRKRKTKIPPPLPNGRQWWQERDNDEINKARGRVIRRLRGNHGWSLRDLSAATGISPSYLSGLERGEHTPSAEMLDRLETGLRMVTEGLRELTNRELKAAGLSPCTVHRTRLRLSSGKHARHGRRTHLGLDEQRHSPHMGLARAHLGWGDA